MFYEIRDHPDDLPVRSKTLADAKQRARRRVEKFGIPVLIYEVCPLTGEKLLEEIS